MHWQHTPYTYPLLGATALSLVLAFYIWQRRSAPGAIPFIAVMLAVAVWSLGYALELASADLPAKLFWAKIQYLGIVTVPVASLGFALHYTNQARWLTHRNLLLLILLPSAALLLAWTNEHHHLIWTSIQLDTSGPFSVLVLTHGAVFWSIVVYDYALLLFGSAIVLRSLFRKPRLYRGQIAAMLLAVLAPWVGNALYVSGLSPFPDLDPTPLAFTLTCLAMAWGLFRFRLLDIVPVARDAVLDSMDDAVIVLDVQGRIVDLNPAAERLVTRQAADIVGQPATTVFAALPALAQRCSEMREGHGEIRQGDGENRRILDLRGSPLRDARGRPIGWLIALRDITERKRLEQQSQERRLYLESVLAYAPDAIVTLDAHHQVMEWNRGAEELFGYTRDEAMGRDLDELAAGGNPEAFKEASVFTRQVLDGEPIHPIETVRYRRDGMPVDVILAGSPIFVQGEMAGVVAIYTNITERKRAEQGQKEVEKQREQAREALRRRNRELALLNRVIAASAASREIKPILETVCRELAEAFDLPHSAAALLDAEKTEISVVAEYRAGGRSPVVGQAVAVTAMPLAQDLIEHKQPLMIDDARFEPRLGHVRSLIPPDQPLPLLLLPILIEGEIVGGLGMAATGPRPFLPEEVYLARRVAEQVSGALARAKLAETERRLSTAVDQAAEAVMVADAEATILYVNPAFERIVGYSRAEVIGQPSRVLKSSRLDMFFQREMWRAEAGRQAWQERVDFTKRDGLVCNLDLTVAPVRDQAGEIVSYVTTMRDATREAQLEAEFQQAQKMEALGRLAGGVAHDFNNLLTIIKGSAQILGFKLPPGDPLHRHTRQIQETVDRAAKLTGQLVSFSRREVIRPRVLNLNRVVHDLSSMLQRIIGEDIQFVAVLAEDLWHIEADPTQIDQVITNLVVNARDAMPEGGALTIETANVTFDHAYAEQHLEAQPGEYVRLTISDTGGGMDDDTMARIFEPFFTTKPEGQGSGLGLATVFGIVTQSRGRIEVHSKVDVGTVFMIYLPRALEEQPVFEVPTHTLPLVPGHLLRGTETVLVVEDDPAVREVMVGVLESCGYQVLAAGDGLGALQVGKRYDGPIHLLLSDVVLPYLKGGDLASRLLLARPEMRVLYVSGYTGGAIAEQGVLEPGVFFLPKPFSIEDLARTVREVLDNRR